MPPLGLPFHASLNVGRSWVRATEAAQNAYVSVRAPIDGEARFGEGGPYVGLIADDGYRKVSLALTSEQAVGLGRALIQAARAAA